MDDSGVPTAWEPVDMPSGDGESDFELIFEATVSENAASFTQSVDSQGNAFELKELVCIVWTPAYTDESITAESRDIGFVSDARWGYHAFPLIKTLVSTDGVGKYSMLHIKLVNNVLMQQGRWESQNSSSVFGVLMPTNKGGDAPLNFETDITKLFQTKNPQGKATCVKIVGYANNIVPAGTIIRLYGKRV